MTKKEQQRLDQAAADRERMIRFSQAPASFVTAAKEQEETADEARARLLPVNTARLAKEAADDSPQADTRPRWKDLALSVFITLLAMVLFWGAVEWYWMVRP